MTDNRNLTQWRDETGLLPAQAEVLRLLATEPSMTAIARQTGLSRSTLYRYLEDPKFKLRLTEETSSILSAAAFSCVNGFAESVEILRKAAQGQEYDGQEITPQMVAACKVLIGRTPHVLEMVSMHIKLAEIESRLAELGFDLEAV